MPEHGVVAYGRRSHEADSEAILGDVTHSGFDLAAGRGVREVDSVDHDSTGFTPAEARENLGKLGLTVSGHAGDPDDLTGAYGERDVVECDEPS